ncbi:MAG: hypothetical protein U9R66_11435 [Thermodesulfobacteriota bacterium]|nr:hypothetical protein [Thermodesulfobacteriota bacterium]
MKRCALFVLPLLLLFLNFPLPANAHNLKLFGSVEGRTISGYAYYSGGGRPAGVTVSLLGPDGEHLGEAVTSDKGEFELEAPFKADLLLTLNTGDGHTASWQLTAGEFPDDPARLKPVVASSRIGNEEESSDQRKYHSLPETGFSPVELQKMVAAAVSDAIKPLQQQIILYRSQLDGYENKIRFHDILGGIGYILGMAGLFMMIKGRKSGD